jgi:cytochrome P450
MFIFAMTLFPDKQTKVQQEIDRVVGPNRLPEFSDRRSLPHVEAVLQEVMRVTHSFWFGNECLISNASGGILRFLLVGLFQAHSRSAC